MTEPSQIQIHPDADALAVDAARRFVAAGQAAIERKGVFTAALCGGNTPRPLYQRIAQEHRLDLDWTKVHFFWGDERAVPPDSPDSNFGLAWETIFRHVRIPAWNLHRIPTSTEIDTGTAADAERAAAEYERILREFFGGGTIPGDSFDFTLLGVGENGHTASLMPDAQPDPFAAPYRDRLAMAVWVPHLHAFRITLTPQILNRSQEVLFLVSGEKKAPIMREILSGPSARYPAQRISPLSGNLTWLLDQGAATGLSIAA